MEVSYKWLKEYIDFPYDPAELAEKLTMAGMEVDGMTYLGENLTEIVIGEITEITEHPNADKLVICLVNTGDEELQIITGASNVFTGAKVPVAKDGVVLPNGMEIKKTKLRGESSSGMLCSTDELGLSEERAAGIMILSEQAEVGQKLVDYLNLNDYVLSLDLTPNYARCLGMLGIARELKAMQQTKDINWPTIGLKETEDEINDYVSVEVLAEDLCPRYTGRVIKNVKIGPSPEWMQKRLTAAGIRPINNVVDITNYVLMEYNQPLHAFDLDKVTDQKVLVRRAGKNEEAVTLDEKEHKLDEDILVIADSVKPVGLAGVMGGANSEVTEKTSTVFLESAYFNPVNIRKTAKKLSLPSEASHRFERGVDIEKLIEASNRAAYLMQEYAEGQIVKGIIDIYPQPFELLKLDLEISLVNKILGLELSQKQVLEMLAKLEFKSEIKDDNTLIVTVPSYRNDVTREADLIEEIARIYGYNNIPVTNPESSQQGGKSAKQSLESLTREIMVSSGLDEVVNLSLTSTDYYDQLGISENSNLRNWVKIKNPLSEAFAIMRTTLLPGIIEVLTNNARRQIDQMAVFEIGKVFNDTDEKSFAEKVMLAGGSMGYPTDKWKANAADFFYLKGVVDSYSKQLGIENLSYEQVELPYLHPGRTAAIKVNGQQIGIIGEILPALVKEFDLTARTAIFEMNFELIQQQVNLDKNYQPLPKYPAVERDLAILVNREINAGDIQQTIKARGGELLKQVTVFDLYQGDQIPAKKKSLAFKLIFQSEDRTLRDQEINRLFNKILKELEKNYEAKIRG